MVAIANRATYAGLSSLIAYSYQRPAFSARRRSHEARGMRCLQKIRKPCPWTLRPIWAQVLNDGAGREPLLQQEGQDLTGEGLAGLHIRKMRSGQFDQLCTFNGVR